MLTLSYHAHHHRLFLAWTCTFSVAPGRRIREKNPRFLRTEVRANKNEDIVHCYVSVRWCQSVPCLVSPSSCFFFQARPTSVLLCGDAGVSVVADYLPSSKYFMFRSTGIGLLGSGVAPGDRLSVLQEIDASSETTTVGVEILFVTLGSRNNHEQQGTLTPPPQT